MPRRSFALFASMICCRLTLIAMTSMAAASDATIEWGRPIDIGKGLYARVHHLSDGRLMAAFTADEGLAVAFAEKRKPGTWSEPQIAARHFPVVKDGEEYRMWLANAEFAQLESSRIILACNVRPQDRRHDVHPYSIAVTVSDDGGNSWSPLKIVYRAEMPFPPDGGEHGCYEPFVLAGRGGMARIYFADETPYAREGKGFQNISFVETRNGGGSWNAAKVAAYKPECRDGMPAVLMQGKWIFLALESDGGGTHLHPEVVRMRQGEAGQTRSSPLAGERDWRVWYGGAPYIAATKNYILLSWQQLKGDHALHDGARAHVAVFDRQRLAKSGVFGDALVIGSPGVGDASPSMLWNSLCPIGGDYFFLVSEIAGRIVLFPGRIVNSEKG